MTKLIGGNISDTPIKNIGDGSALSAGGGGVAALISMETPADINTTYSSTTELLAPSSNTDGVLVNWAHLTSPSGSTVFSSILAATSSPSSFTDGRAIMIGRGALSPHLASSWNAVVIPAGYGIYVVPNGVTVGVTMGWSALPSNGVIFPTVGESIAYGSGYTYLDVFTAGANTNGAIVTGFTIAGTDGTVDVYIGANPIAWTPGAVGSFAGGPMLIEAGKNFRLYHWGATAWGAAAYTLL